MAVVSDPEPACRPDNSGACLRLHLAHICGRGNALDQEKRNVKSCSAGHSDHRQQRPCSLHEVTSRTSTTPYDTEALLRLAEATLADTRKDYLAALTRVPPHWCFACRSRLGSLSVGESGPSGKGYRTVRTSIVQGGAPRLSPLCTRIWHGDYRWTLS